ncbi:MAG: NAD/FAD-utilizing enzyme [Porticoccus sp.]|nr:NAD/FAD-utilizing enzyme [Porticoccus sp.]
MRRHYYISDDLDDLESIERELESQGLTTPQIHVLSRDDKGVQEHHLNKVNSFMKNDVVHSTTIAALFGFLCAVLVLAVAQFSGVTETVGWIPFIFFAVVVMGIITWEGGMWGIQEPNVHFKRFQKALKSGKHILYVEVKKDQEAILTAVTDNHPRLLAAGVEDVATGLLISTENGARYFVKWAP